MCLRKLGWEQEEEHERIAREIKRSLFSSAIPFRKIVQGGVDVGGRGEGILKEALHDLDISCNQPEESMR